MICKCKPIYAERNTEAQGSHYTKHVCHMTGEGLHDKSEIAAELAHRDIEIERLTKRLEAAESSDVVTPEYLQSWIDRAYEAEATIKAIVEMEQVTTLRIRRLSECNPEFTKAKWVLASSPSTGDKYETLEALLNRSNHEN